ncbi:MAG TPA: potassium channel family protein [Pirellulales bacterium]|nr:potassium channel family protein [Pirellulales bacterium]
MHFVFGLGGLILIALVLVDAFEAVVLPRRVTRKFRPARVYYRLTWIAWRAIALGMPRGKRREDFLSIFGPLSLLALFAAWAAALIVGFALVHWSLGSPLFVANHDDRPSFGLYLYMSGVTFFTLGFGDVAPSAALGRVIAVAEAGTGFAFLAIIIGYLPSFSQASSQREITISLLDARSGSPPTAAEGILRAARVGRVSQLAPFFAEWERWAAQLLESHLSYPMLVYYRSQHDNQSWLAALTAVLDGCALVIAGIKEMDSYQAQLTFAMARHTIVDLSLVLKVPPSAPAADRLPPDEFQRLRRLLAEAGVSFDDGSDVEKRLVELRAMYEPFAAALSQRLLFSLPPILSAKEPVDNWQTSPWTRRTPGIGALPTADAENEHFQ